MSNIDISENSFHEQYFYNQFLKAYGKTAEDITTERWRKDLMILATHLSVNPVIDDAGVVNVSNSDRALSPISGDDLCVEMSFKSGSISENFICHFIAVLDCVLSFDVNGNFLPG